MRHRKSGIKLNRTGSHRNAMFRNMVTSLFKYERIRTTDAKAKELRRWADQMITLAKKGDLHARRKAMSIIREKDVVHQLFETAGERFGGRQGGYTRIVKLGHRPGDAASISLIELIISEKTEKKKKRKSQSKKASAAVAASVAEAAPAQAESTESKESAAPEAPETPEAEASEPEADTPVQEAADAEPTEAPEAAKASEAEPTPDAESDQKPSE